MLKLKCASDLIKLGFTLICAGKQLHSERYKPHKSILDQKQLDKIEQAVIGTYDGFTFYFIDGDSVRDIDIDFVAGGNPARYLYVPENHIWIERLNDNKDAVDCLVHEYKETKKMIDHGWTYDKAHDYANSVCNKIREKETIDGDIFGQFKKFVDKY